ncbi:hypothetical protein [Cystobacter fuscus]|nr:hypothetical protein [Cystobacter fuscus]
MSTEDKHTSIPPTAVPEPEAEKKGTAPRALAPVTPGAGHRLAVPRWAELLAVHQAALRRWEDMLTHPDDSLRLTVLTLYVKLEHLGLWDFVGEPVQSTGGGRLEFRCPDVPGLKQALRLREDFTSPENSPKDWSCRELRKRGSLHFKHFSGWTDEVVQAHIDKEGLYLMGWRNLFLPIQAVLHLLDARANGYTDVFGIRDILLAQGLDPVALKGR